MSTIEVEAERLASTNGHIPDDHPLHRLTPEQLEEIAKEFRAIHDEVFADLGEEDSRYIHRIIRTQRQLAAAGRALLIASRFWPAWLAGTTCLSVAKILENMEIGHNVLHGQWDWMNDPYVHSSSWDWDTASPSNSWKHSHNYIHHTYTQIVGKDKDVGYEIMRVDPRQKWHPAYLLQPIYNIVLAALFEWGVAVHDLDFEAIRRGEKDMKLLREELKGIATKARRQIVKDYIAWPLISGAVMSAIEVAVIALFDPEPETGIERIPNVLRHPGGGLRRGGVLGRLIRRRSFREPFRATLTADVVANLVRNFWSYAIIFCGHFPDQAYTFTEEEVEGETPGGWYVRQLIGAANIDGGPLFHIMSGNLSFQVEHHLYPDMPSSRYQQIAPRVRDVCERYGLPYNTGPFRKQFGMVQRTILRLAFPGGAPRPKPGPWREAHRETGDQDGLPAFP